MRSPDDLPRLYALLAGLGLTLVGIGGFIVAGPGEEGALGLGVGIWHNLIHIATGAPGIVAARRADSAVAYSLALGALYVGVTIATVTSAGEVGAVIPVGPVEIVLHTGLGLAGIGAVAARSLSRRRTGETGGGAR